MNSNGNKEIINIQYIIPVKNKQLKLQDYSPSIKIGENSYDNIHLGKYPAENVTIGDNCYNNILLSTPCVVLNNLRDKLKFCWKMLNY